MRSVLVTVVGLLVVDLLIIATSTGSGYTAPLLLGFGFSLAIGAIVVGVSSIIRRFIRRRSGDAAIGASVSLSRTWVVGGAMLLLHVTARLLVSRAGPGAAEVFLFLAPIGVGVALARWAQSGPTGPLWVAIGVLLLIALGEAVAFTSDSDAQFQFGPEIRLFMLWGIAARLNTLPVNAAILWSTWRLFAPDQREAAYPPLAADSGR